MSPEKYAEHLISEYGRQMLPIRADLIAASLGYSVAPVKDHALHGMFDKRNKYMLVGEDMDPVSVNVLVAGIIWRIYAWPFMWLLYGGTGGQERFVSSLLLPQGQLDTLARHTPMTFESLCFRFLVPADMLRRRLSSLAIAVPERR